jgi:hypothetical protein
MKKKMIEVVVERKLPSVCAFQLELLFPRHELRMLTFIVICQHPDTLLSGPLQLLVTE